MRDCRKKILCCNDIVKVFGRKGFLGKILDFYTNFSNQECAYIQYKNRVGLFYGDEIILIKMFRENNLYRKGE